MKPFRERNPVVIGAISIALIALLLLTAFRADDMPLIGGGDTYYASFEEAGGLKPGDPVRIAGVRVGKVDTIELADGAVRVGFKIKTDAEFGDKTQAKIKVQTILGQMYLALCPPGRASSTSGTTIPVERTQSPYDVVDAFTGLAETSEGIDTDQLAKALDHDGRPDPQHAGGVPGGAQGVVRAVEGGREARRRDRLPAEEHPAGLQGA